MRRVDRQIATPAGLVAYRTSGEIDAIDSYSRCLTAALEDLGVPARYDPMGPSPSRIQAPIPWCLISYNPFSYGHCGVPPGLLADVVRLRSRVRGPVVLMVHEPWIQRWDWRSSLMHVYQRIQLAILVRLVDVVLCATEAQVRALGRGAIHAPIGADIPPVAMSQEAARDQLGLGNELVVALFGTTHPTRALDHATAALTALVRSGREVTVLNLGANAPHLPVPGASVTTPGPLSAFDISLRLRASDMLLTPFTDGVSTRRSSMMAGLSHGTPVVGHRGTSTDRVLSQGSDAIMLVDAEDSDGYTRAVLELAADPARRRALGAAGRDLYAAHFDWAVVARFVIDALSARGGQVPLVRG